MSEAALELTGMRVTTNVRIRDLRNDFTPELYQSNKEQGNENLDCRVRRVLYRYRPTKKSTIMLGIGKTGRSFIVHTQGNKK